MLFRLVSLFSLLSMAFALPQQLTFAPTSNPSTSPCLLDAFAFSCPSFKVNCVLDKDWWNPVGNIGPQPYKRVGLRCNQAHEARNTKQCNAEFPVCEGRCEAYGPLPF
ncbi:hypothetical protein BCR35DRAFT_300824 [Leucosporidium creatinivorum]|uniref:Uncharacterized protein n=1 Tax=Leucosporidium creatinivorum TaxID=106004 RepID=A0A1Y2FYB2_9BASI|nr:hypothetical protein BCR35DRAFT_300824 [Leucosporidium creatinivorum]